jgi:DNA polymerase-1
LLYLGRDRSDEKRDDDAWRSNYKVLDGVPSAEWPDRARNYPLADAEGTLRIWQKQNERAIDNGLSFEDGLNLEAKIETEEFQVGVAFCLRLIECWGIAIDGANAEEIEKQLREELQPSRMTHLTKAQILFRKGDKRVHQVKKHVKGCPKGSCACPRVAATKTVHKAEETSRTELLRLVERVCIENGLPVPRKDPTEKALEEDEGAEGNICADKNVLQEIAHFHPALSEYQYRQYLSKLVNTELPRMRNICGMCHGTGKSDQTETTKRGKVKKILCPLCKGDGRLAGYAPIVYPRYNVLVETGRTSSFAAEEYPSCNIQNVSAVKTLRDAEGEPTGQVNIRECYVPRPRRWLCSIDFAALEFCSMGQVCYDLFGYSVMRDLINAGHDPHAYLGAQIALAQHEDFAAVVSDYAHDPMAVYAAFKRCEHDEDEGLRKFYKQYRKLAKPVGFGFPGGLGVKKFIGFAAAHPYYVKVTEDQAKALKEIWFRAFPEMRDYFNWVNSQEVDGTYNYTTPFGMVRAKCTYTAMCNGRLLQSPAAEGAKLAVWHVVRACYDPALASILHNERVLAFVHDELLFEFSGTKQEIHDKAHEAARIMVAAMQMVLPEVKITAKPALMDKWNKDAETVYDEAGLLTIWHPKKKAA